MPVLASEDAAWRHFSHKERKKTAVCCQNLGFHCAFEQVSRLGAEA